MRLFQLALISFALGTPLPKAPEQDAFELKTYHGKVVFLPEALSGKQLKYDTEWVARQAVLVEPEGTIAPLLCDDASRAFFLDDRVRNRKVEVIARKYKGLPYLQVVTFKIENEGKLQTPEYYCEVCSISVRYPQDCPCCQGPLIYRMKSESR